MGYSNNDAMIRVDFFRTSGKWYVAEAVLWTGGWESKTQSIFNAFAQSLRDHFKTDPQRLSGMDAVCLKPYHQHAHPIQIRNGAWNDTTLFPIRIEDKSLPDNISICSGCGDSCVDGYDTVFDEDANPYCVCCFNKGIAAKVQKPTLVSDSNPTITEIGRAHV